MSAFLVLGLAATALGYPAVSKHHHTPLENATDYLVSVGPRPYYIISNMTDSPLKRKLQSCENTPVSISPFTIGHRGGGTLQFPEESIRSQDAGARMGAGILECDVAFTSDRGLVCRHDLCDLHRTTDILLRPELAAKCTTPFASANATSPANALCCTSDITTDECTSSPPSQQTEPSISTNKTKSPPSAANKTASTPPPPPRSPTKPAPPSGAQNSTTHARRL